MKATNLRLGNIVALIDQPENPYRVLMLEPGLVHLMNRYEADDENNIIGVPMSKEILEKFQIPLNSWHLRGKTNKIRIKIKVFKRLCKWPEEYISNTNKILING
jgi:hypothetical protein